MMKSNTFRLVTLTPALLLLRNLDHEARTSEATRKAEKVFSIVELLEAILMLGCVGSALRVSKHWNAVVTGSHAIKRQLYLYKMKTAPTTETTDYKKFYDENHPLGFHTCSPIQSAYGGYWDMKFDGFTRVPVRREFTFAKVVFTYSDDLPAVHDYKITTFSSEVDVSSEREAKKSIPDRTATLKPGWLLDNIMPVANDMLMVVESRKYADKINIPAKDAQISRSETERMDLRGRIFLVLRGGTSLGEMVRKLDSRLEEWRAEERIKEIVTGVKDVRIAQQDGSRSMLACGVQ